jgi:hypothetical protein
VGGNSGAFWQGVLPEQSGLWNLNRRSRAVGRRSRAGPPASQLLSSRSSHGTRRRSEATSAANWATIAQTVSHGSLGTRSRLRRIGKSIRARQLGHGSGPYVAGEVGRAHQGRGASNRTSVSARLTTLGLVEPFTHRVETGVEVGLGSTRWSAGVVRAGDCGRGSVPEGGEGHGASGSGWGAWVAPLDVEVVEDPADGPGVDDEGDYPHRPATEATGHGVNFVNPANEVGPTSPTLLDRGWVIRASPRVVGGRRRRPRCHCEKCSAGARERRRARTIEA